MTHFLCKLLPPRPTFPHNMTPDEAALMQEHVAYWTGLVEKGTAVAFGPVLDPQGVWGLGLVETRDEAETRALTDADPVSRAGLGFAYEIYAMPRTVVHPAPASMVLQPT